MHMVGALKIPKIVSQVIVGYRGCVKNDGSMNFGFCMACGSVDPCFALFILTAWLALGAPGPLAALLFAIMRIGIQ